MVGPTALVKIFNAVASLGLGVCIGLVPFFGNKGHTLCAVSLLCAAGAFAGRFKDFIY